MCPVNNKTVLTCYLKSLTSKSMWAFCYLMGPLLTDGQFECKPFATSQQTLTPNRDRKVSTLSNKLQTKKQERNSSKTRTHINSIHIGLNRAKGLFHTRDIRLR